MPYGSVGRGRPPPPKKNLVNTWFEIFKSKTVTSNNIIIILLDSFSLINTLVSQILFSYCDFCDVFQRFKSVKNCWKLLLEGWKCYFRDPIIENLPGEHSPENPLEARVFGVHHVPLPLPNNVNPTTALINNRPNQKNC